MGRLICLALPPASLAPISRVASAAAWGTDRFKSLCFDQAEMAFTPGVLAFTRVVIADRIGDEVGASEVSVAPGQILDADIYFNSGDPNTTFATPLAGGRKSEVLRSLRFERGQARNFAGRTFLT